MKSNSSAPQLQQSRKHSAFWVRAGTVLRWPHGRTVLTPKSLVWCVLAALFSSSNRRAIETRVERSNFLRRVAQKVEERRVPRVCPVCVARIGKRSAGPEANAHRRQGQGQGHPPTCPPAWLLAGLLSSLHVPPDRFMCSLLRVDGVVSRLRMPSAPGLSPGQRL